MKKVYLFFALSLCFSFSLIHGEPIHEAFVTPIKGSVVLEAVGKHPPDRLTETIPEQPDPIAEWIPGYWFWNKKKGDFDWICGVWRKPPPGHIWNSGFWVKFDEGFVWIPGFWHTRPAQHLTYIQKPPPAPIDADIQNPPENDQFWASGYWKYNQSQNSYSWLKGTWVKMNPEWVFTPATYIWRPEGYLFIPSYWDWPLDERGNAYCAIFTNPPERGVISTPTIIIEPEIIIESLFIYWPDYTCFFHYWWFYHPDFWVDQWCCTPPWWNWGSWWWFDWSSQWQIWWWWGNPGFPFPWWMPVSLNAMIPPPPPELFPLIGNASPPNIIVPNGAIPPNSLIDSIRDLTRNDRPILPADPQIRDDILDRIKPPRSDAGDIRPDAKPGGREPKKPWQKPEKDIDISRNPQRVPSIPDRPSLRPPIHRIPIPAPSSRRPRGPSTQPPPQDQRPRQPWPQQTPDFDRGPSSRRPSYPRPDSSTQPPSRRPQGEFQPPSRRPSYPRPDSSTQPPSRRPQGEFQPPSRRPSYPRPDSSTQPPSRRPQWTPPTQSVPRPMQINPNYMPRRPEMQKRKQTTEPSQSSDMFR